MKARVLPFEHPAIRVRRRHLTRKAKLRLEGMAGLGLLAGLALLGTPGHTGYPWWPGDVVAVVLCILALRILPQSQDAVDGTLRRPE